jgi:hypothetical protein
LAFGAACRAGRDACARAIECIDCRKALAASLIFVKGGETPPGNVIGKGRLAPRRIGRLLSASARGNDPGAATASSRADGAILIHINARPISAGRMT